jgi:hypothetical protein
MHTADHACFQAQILIRGRGEMRPRELPHIPDAHGLGVGLPANYPTRLPVAYR